MADYWKSNPRKFCEVCKCWFGDNQISVNFHEQGLRHKANVARQLREARKNTTQADKDKKKTEELLAQINHAAYSAYQSDLTSQNVKAADPSVMTATPDDNITVNSKALNIASSLVAERRKELEKYTIKNNIDQKVKQIKQQSMAWQALLSPEGYTYYYNYMTGATQWEVPPGFTAPQTYQPTTTTKAPATQSAVTELPEPAVTLAHKRDLPLKEAHDDTSGEESSPKRPKRLAPYGCWETVAEYDVEQPVETATEAAESEEEDKEPEIEFEEKTLPLPVKEEYDHVNTNYSGGFKKFSFKKSKGSRKMRQRTSETV